MSLYDKFGIIENHLNNDDGKKISSKMEYYFENLLNSDIKVLMSDYVNQVIWFDGIQLEQFGENLELQIKNYLIQRRNNIRTFIKKDSYDISSLNKFIKTFITKIEYLNSMVKSSNDKLIKESINKLTNLIISDSLIMMFIEDTIIDFPKDKKDEIKNLLEITKTFQKYDNQDTFNKMLNTFGNIYRKYLINLEELPLPENIRRVQKFNEILQNTKTIGEFYGLNKEDYGKMTTPVLSLLIESFINIISNNSIDDIEFVFENTWSNFKKIILENQYENKDESIKKISEQIIKLINRSIKKTEQTNIFKIIYILKFVDSLFSTGSDSTSQYKEIMNQHIGNILSSESLIENIHQNIDSMMKESKIDQVIIIISFVNNIKDKDLFVVKYNEYLIKRLMEKLSSFKFDSINDNLKDSFYSTIKQEKHIADVLRNKFGDKLLYKTIKIINDTESSFEDNINFANIKIENHKNKLDVITTSYNNWDINQTEGIVNGNMVEQLAKENTIMGKHLKYYQKYYQLRYSNKRILNWFPHFGEVNIIYQNQKLKMLPIQFMVLEMFNDTNRLEIIKVTKAGFFANYAPKFIKDVITSLLSSGLLKLQDDYIILSTNGEFKSNLIEIFFNVSDYAGIWEQKRRDELAHDREEIVNTNINHFIKRQSMSRTELFDCVKKSIQVFELDERIFDKSIDYMCKMDYIKLSDGKYQKLVY